MVDVCHKKLSFLSVKKITREVSGMAVVLIKHDTTERCSTWLWSGDKSTQENVPKSIIHVDTKIK